MASATQALKEKAGLVKKKPSFMEMLEAMRPQIAMALPRHLTPERMIRIALTSVRLNPRLLDCTPESLIAAIMISSQLGLEPGVMGQSFLVPFKHKDHFVCQLIPGWMGVLDLVNRSGKCTAWTGAVYSGDFFDWSLGDQPYLRHKPCGDETTLTHVYAIARPVNAQWPIIEVQSIEKVWNHRNKINRIGEDHYSYKWPEQYARKIPLLQALKYVPKSIELQAALSLDSAAETGGQVLAIKDVPSIVEGTGVFNDLPEPQAKTETKKSQLPDEMCAECRTINGHTLDCKFHPRNQQEQKPATSDKSPSKADALNEGGKQEVAAQQPTSAEKANPFKNAPSQKNAPSEKEEQTKILVRVHKVEKKKTAKGADYYRITAVDEDVRAQTLVCFHLNRGAEIYDKYQENGLAVFLVREKHDRSKPYYEVDDILSLAGRDYKDGKPIPDQATLADDETW